jgi:hypothetical protein
VPLDASAVPLDERRRPQVLAVQPQEVERGERGVAPAEKQRGELGAALRVEANDFAIEDGVRTSRRAKLSQRRGKVL